MRAKLCHRHPAGLLARILVRVLCSSLGSTQRVPVSIENMRRLAARLLLLFALAGNLVPLGLAMTAPAHACCVRKAAHSHHCHEAGSTIPPSLFSAMRGAAGAIAGALSPARSGRTRSVGGPPFRSKPSMQGWPLPSGFSGCHFCAIPIFPGSSLLLKLPPTLT